MGWFRKHQPVRASFTSDVSHGLADVHSHVLFGVDDGARTLEESSAMLDGLAALGFDRVAATPHFDCRAQTPSLETQRSIIAEIERRRAKRSPSLVTGGECVFDDAFVSLQSDGQAPRIGAGESYLVELGFFPGSVPHGLENVFFKLQLKGCVLIAAHPERVPDLQRDRERAAKIRLAGLLFQLDVMALAGKYGRIAERTAFDLLERGMIDLAATDLHSAADLPLLERGMEALYRWDSGEFNRLFSVNPGKILDGQEVEQDDA